MIALRLSLALAGVLSLAAAPALTEADFPSPRAGQWEETAADDGGPAKVTLRCESGARMKAGELSARGDCDRPRVTHTGDTWAIAVSCRRADAHVDLTLTATGDFQRAFNAESLTVGQRQGEAAKTRRTVTHNRYLGPCPATAAPRP